MTIAYFDCFSGIAGDMALGALIDCGVPLDALRQGLSSLPVHGWQLEARPVLRSGIHGLDVTVTLDGVTDAAELRHAHDHAHDHHHSHEHTHHHEHRHVHGRSMQEIREIIESSDLNERVRRTSLDIFGRIAQAEAYLHHSTPDEIHFHEIGGVDSLIDICGVAWCLDYLEVDEIHCSVLPYSTGFVDCTHGRMPVPAPATLELLKGATMVPTDIRGELITPTGAGILAALSRSYGPPPAMAPRHIGFGSGKKDFADRPNLLRVVIGERVSQLPAGDAEGKAGPAALETELAGLEWQTMVLVQSNIDDMNPEFFDHVFERLFAAGAVDVWLQPVQMKKTRPGSMLSALCHQPAQAQVIAAMLRETTTLGVRSSEVRRAALPRESRTVDTPFGAVRVKIAHWPGRDLRRATPEYADVARLAASHQVPAREVYQAALLSAEDGRGTAQKESNDRLAPSLSSVSALGETGDKV